MKTAAQILADAKAEAEKVVATATTAAADVTAAAKDKGEAAVAEAQVKAKKLVDEAAAAAKKLTDDAVAAALAAKDETATATTDILGRCVAAKLSLDDAHKIVVESKGNLAAAQDMIIAKVVEKAGDQTHHPAVVTADARDKMKAGVTKALLQRGGFKEGERNEFSSMTLREIARSFVDARGGSKHADFHDPLVMVGEAFRPIMQAGMESTSDFANVLANVARIALLKGYMEAGETFPQWTARGVLVDFRPQKRVDLNLFPSLKEVPEGAEYKFGAMGDRGESIVLATYGRMFAITRQAIVNDDLNVFTRIPLRMGRAASRTIGNLAYAVLTGNPVMADGFALFDAVNHKNVAASAGPMSVVSIDAGRASMALQKDPDGIVEGGLNIAPSFLMVPVEKKGIAQVLMTAQYDPLGETIYAPNYVNGMAAVVADARLSANSPNSWYLLANPNQYDTIEVAYLNGNDQPVMEQRDGWNVDGVEFKVRIDAGVKALDFRGVYKNGG